MKNLIFIAAALFFLQACALKTYHESSGAEEKEIKSAPKSSSESAKSAGIVVDAKAMALLDRMAKAVEAYVFKNDKKEFKVLCQDKHFDCFVSEKPFPKGKKKINRTVPPYASGAKMGLHGEERVQVKYDFYP